MGGKRNIPFRILKAGPVMAVQYSDVFFGDPVVPQVIQDTDKIFILLPVHLFQFHMQGRVTPHHLRIKKEG
ncbi:hypothetical protein FQZ97_1106480 [compost metagenome]